MKLLSKYKLELILFVVAFFMLSVVFVFSNLRFANDDQFILYRYIENISSGNGFVYNIDERILGSTTPLFTLLASLLVFLLKGFYLPDIVAFLNIFLISLSTIFLYKIVNLFVPKNTTIFAVLLFVLNMAKIVSEGMESTLFILTSLAFLWFLFEKRFYVSSVLIGLLFLIRPDALLIALPTLIYWYREVGFKATAKFVFVSVLTVLPWLVFATIYFGSFIPQSLLAKLDTANIVNQSSFQAFKVQLASLSRIYWGKIFDPENIKLQVLLNLTPIFVFACVGLKRMVNKNFWILPFIPIVYFVSFGLSNPIMFPWYFTQMETFWLIISFVGFVFLLEKIKIPFLKIIFIVFLAVGPIFYYSNFLITNNTGSKKGLFEISEFLKQNTKSGERVGVNNIGIIGFVSKLKIVDFFGLTNDFASKFYPLSSICRDRNIQYQVPPNLIEFARPEWVVFSGESEMLPCVKSSKWFKNNYTLIWQDYGLIYKIKK